MAKLEQYKEHYNCISKFSITSMLTNGILLPLISDQNMFIVLFCLALIMILIEHRRIVTTWESKLKWSSPHSTLRVPAFLPIANCDMAYFVL